jgi:hypothetical protein
MSQIINSLPELELIVLFSLLNIARFENQLQFREPDYEG